MAVAAVEQGAAAPRPGLPDVEADIAAAERAGLKLALTGRPLALLPVAAWYGGIGALALDLAGLLGVGLFILAGLVHYALIDAGRERPWHRYAFVSLDTAGLCALAVLTPLSTGGDVLQILVFRAYGVYYFFLFLALAALSLSPRLVLFAGVAATAALWVAFGVIVAGMERRVSWGDLPRGADAETYLALFLDPDFIGTSNRIKESIAILLTAAILALAVRRARDLVHARAAAERQRARVQAVFGQYVPTAAAEAILADGGAALAPQTRNASILFCDIEGFTSLSERREPAEVIRLLNGFFAAATRTIDAEGGIVVSFVGDAVVAAFNAPLDLPDHAARAVRAGQGLLAMAAAMRFEGERLRLRVAIATGRIAAGSVGGAERQTSTVYGDTVNLAQRLEALGKTLGTRLLACATTEAQAGPAAGLVELGTVPVPGREASARLFTVPGAGGDAPPRVDRHEA